LVDVYLVAATSGGVIVSPEANRIGLVMGCLVGDDVSDRGIELIVETFGLQRRRHRSISYSNCIESVVRPVSRAVSSGSVSGHMISHNHPSSRPPHPSDGLAVATPARAVSARPTLTLSGSGDWTVCYSSTLASGPALGFPTPNSTSATRRPST
jgi:hypothetical protein